VSAVVAPGAPIGANEVVASGLAMEYATVNGLVRAVDCSHLRVAAGTSVAVMGPSGCGKSTLLGLLAGLAVPTRGSIRIGPTTVSALQERERVEFRRRNVGMIYQADNLLPHLTVEENVGLQLAICRVGQPRPPSGARPEDGDPRPVLDRLGLGALARRFPDQLSGGQRQRTAVARAVIHRPAVILADEPTGSLDDASAGLVIELLVDVQREIGATLVLVTHDDEIAGRLDRVFRLPSTAQFPGTQAWEERHVD
jgi:putative ABC transport system ATP-binding protein